MTVWELFRLGGVFMWPLLIFLIIMTASAVERIIVFAVTDFRIDMSFISGNILADNEKSDYKNNEFYKILSGNLKICGADRDLFDKYMSSDCQGLIDRLKHGLSIISGIAGIAPVTGFLGTVTGMISVFRSINAASDVSAQLVAGGIYEALITTAAGLIISLLASVSYFILNSIVVHYAHRMENVTSAVMKSVFSHEIKNR